MFIAMNRFQVKKGAEQAFETLWATRESYLGNMVSGADVAEATGCCAVVSVIGLSLLPLAPRQAEIAEQGCKHEEGDH